MQNSSAEKLKSWLMRCKAYWLGEWFDPHTSFLKLPSFWAPFIIILLLFSLLCWKVASDNQLVLSWNWTVQGMYEWFRIPFWVLALLIPVIGLFNANHKSEQARAAMELTRSQNNFANYFKHFDEFKVHMKAVEISGDVNLRAMHKIVFPMCTRGVHRPSDDFLKIFINSRNLLFSQFIRLDGEQDKIIEITQEIENIVRSFNVVSGNCVAIKELMKKPYAINYGGKQHKISYDNLYLHLQLNIFVFYLFEHAFKFDVEGGVDVDSEGHNLCFKMYDGLAHAVAKKWGVIYEEELKHIYPLGKALRD